MKAVGHEPAPPPGFMSFGVGLAVAAALADMLAEPTRAIAASATPSKVLSILIFSSS
ncbi:MAG: hypothetical protein HYR64_01685 [Fimbriimonas ginsengisoli]|uniref:Uncharacterized protein n=1 Tax=Fimbriimonas ginsengisoli TaxID=1005039 RepID=A0A931PSU5_FIMGI|nr:hypothetical protein [Fimbriimonas ginsengisoli]